MNKIKALTPRNIYWQMFLFRLLRLKRALKENVCNHDKWAMDNQIRTIECLKCGKRSSVSEYKDLYSNDSNSQSALTNEELSFSTPKTS
jgi:Zn ribbon nucleic-acid-binding protein